MRRNAITGKTTLDDEEFHALTTLVGKGLVDYLAALRKENVNLRESAMILAERRSQAAQAVTLRDLRRDRLAGCICQHGAIQHRLEQDRACLACDCKRYCCLPGVAGAPFGMRF